MMQDAVVSAQGEGPRVAPEPRKSPKVTPSPPPRPTAPASFAECYTELRPEMLRLATAMTRQFGELIQFSDTPGNIDTPPPRVGENTREILGELGYDDPAIDALFGANVINWPQPDYPWTI